MRIATMDQPTFTLTWGERDWWPLARLLIVCVALGLFAHLRLGWNPHARDLWAIPGGIAVLLSFVIMLSSGLAHICFVALMLPLCGIILLNDWFYDSSAWAFRLIIRSRSSPVTAVAGLLGELLLFAGLAFLLWRLFG